jgi:hypothetical protein
MRRYDEAAALSSKQLRVADERGQSYEVDGRG